MKEFYIRMIAAIAPESVDALLKIIDKQMYDGYQRIHLMLSTPGGAVVQGVLLANYLRGIPIELYTYNISAIDSIGILVYAAGKRRFCCPQSRFMMHRVNLTLFNNQVADEQLFLAKLKEVTMDTHNIATLISGSSDMTPEEVITQMSSQTIFDAHAAIACGLCHEVRVHLLPEDASFCSISPDYSVSYYYPAGSGIANKLTESQTR